MELFAVVLPAIIARVISVIPNAGREVYENVEGKTGWPFLCLVTLTCLGSAGEIGAVVGRGGKFAIIDGRKSEMVNLPWLVFRIEVARSRIAE